MKPESVEAQLGLARAQIASGYFLKAVQHLEPLSKSQPGNAELFELLAQGYYGLARKDDAERAENRAKTLRKHEQP